MPRWIVAALLITLFLSLPAEAWGPLTHFTINHLALQQARKGGKALAIRPEHDAVFVGGGPLPDIKFTGGGEYPMQFHNSIEVIDRMIERARTDPRFGAEDVAAALGWAGHLYSEVTTAHTSDGYPNSKVTVTAGSGGWFNHQLNELAIDLLNHRDHRPMLKRAYLAPAMRLIEASMQAEAERDPKASRMTAEQVRSAVDHFLPTPVGVRCLAEWLIEVRPDLLDEMDAFYGDRHQAMAESTAEVVRLLDTHGRRADGKTFLGSADDRQKVRITLNGSFVDRIKGLSLDTLRRGLSHESVSDIFSFISFGLLKSTLGSDLTRDRVVGIARSLGGSSLSNNETHRRVVTRFLEAMLLRPDLTFPEIVAYAQEGTEVNVEAARRRKQQFDRLGLVDGGRRRVSLSEAVAAANEVERLERLRRDWPVFWPLRPNDLQLAAARERAGRALACWVTDRGNSPPALLAAAQRLLASSRELRRQFWQAKVTSVFRPVAKWQAYQQMGRMSDAYGNDQRFLTAVARQCVAAGGANPSPERLANQQRDLTRRLGEIRYVLAQTRAKLDATPKLHLIKRDQLNDQIKALSATEAELADQLRAVAALAGSADRHDVGSAPSPPWMAAPNASLAPCNGAVPESGAPDIASATPVVEAAREIDPPPMTSATEAGSAAKAADADGTTTAAAAHQPGEPEFDPAGLPQMPLEAAEARVNRAYQAYQNLLADRATDDPDLQASLRQLREAQAIRDAALRRIARP